MSKTQQNTPPSRGNVPPHSIQDELDKLVVDQLHKATLNFSEESQETKKLCVTLVAAIFTLLAAFSKTLSSSLEINSVWIALLCASIPLLFWVVDTVTYFYQKKLRYQMQDRLNAIRNRYAIPEENKETQACVFRSFFNSSNLMYPMISLLVFFVAFALMRSLPVDDNSVSSPVNVITCTESPTPFTTSVTTTPSPPSISPQTS